jgi:hypothetical protein
MKFHMQHQSHDHERNNRQAGLQWNKKCALQKTLSRELKHQPHTGRK